MNKKLFFVMFSLIFIFLFSALPVSAQDTSLLGTVGNIICDIPLINNLCPHQNPLPVQPIDPIQNQHTGLGQISITEGDPTYLLTSSDGSDISVTPNDDGSYTFCDNSNTNADFSVKTDSNIEFTNANNRKINLNGQFKTGIARACFQADPTTDKFVALDSQSNVYTYNNTKTVNYHTDWADTNITLQEYLGNLYTTSDADLFVYTYNDSEKFGANQTSMQPDEVRSFKYIIQSDNQIHDNQLMPYIQNGEERHIFNFGDICKASKNASCSFNYYNSNETNKPITNYYLEVTFNSTSLIDPTITLSTSYLFSYNQGQNVTTVDGTSHLTVFDSDFDNPFKAPFCVGNPTCSSLGSQSSCDYYHNTYGVCQSQYNNVCGDNPGLDLTGASESYCYTLAFNYHVATPQFTCSDNPGIYCPSLGESACVASSDVCTANYISPYCSDNPSLSCSSLGETSCLSASDVCTTNYGDGCGGMIDCTGISEGSCTSSSFCTPHYDTGYCTGGGSGCSAGDCSDCSNSGDCGSCGGSWTPTYSGCTTNSVYYCGTYLSPPYCSSQPGCYEEHPFTSCSNTGSKACIDASQASCGISGIGCSWNATPYTGCSTKSGASCSTANWTTCINYGSYMGCAYSYIDCTATGSCGTVSYSDCPTSYGCNQTQAYASCGGGGSCNNIIANSDCSSLTGCSIINNTQNLFLYYPFDTPIEIYPSSGPIYDYSNYSHTGTGAQASFFNQSQCLPGFGSCMSFNRYTSNNYIDTGIYTMPYPLTISLWIKPNMEANYNGGIIQDVTYNPPTGATDLYLDTTYHACFDGNSICSVKNLTKNQWSQLTVTDNSTDICFYINGTLDSCQGGTYKPITVYQPYRIGWFYQSTLQMFTGYMDEFMIINGALNSTQISDIYTNQTKRFASNGIQTLTPINLNITTGDNKVNISLDGYNRLFGTNISINMLNESDGVYNNSDPSLTAYWHLDDPQTYYSSIPDYANNVNNCPLLYRNSNTMIPNGVYHGGQAFDGTYYVDTNQGACPNVLANGNENQTNWTISMWIKTSFTGSWQGLFSDSDNSLGLYFQNGYIQAYGSHNGAYQTYDAFSSGRLVNDGQWHYISVSHKFNWTAFYVDGIMTANATYFYYNKSSSYYYLGGTQGSVSYVGAIDDVQIYNRSLSATEENNLFKYGRFTWTAMNQSANLIGNLYDNSSLNTFTIKNTTSLIKMNLSLISSNQFYTPNVFNTLTYDTYYDNSTGGGADTTYPTFSSYSDNNNTQYSTGTELFNVTVTNTNGTVWLSINGTNYTASNLTSNMYNVTINNLLNGTYVYNWSSYGNGSSNLFNMSDQRSYSVKNLGANQLADCKNLTTANTVYSLVQNVINNTINNDCFIISAQNITLNCAGFYISSTQNYSAVYSNQTNTTVQNCNITMGTGNNTNSAGIRYANGASNSTINNNTIIGSMYKGIDLSYNSNGADSCIVKNNFINITAINGLGIFLQNSNYDNLINNTASTNSGNSAGIYLTNSNSDSLINNTGITNASSAIFLNIGLNDTLTNNIATAISGNALGTTLTNNSLFINNTGTSFTGAGIIVYNALNNTLINNTAIANLSGTGAITISNNAYGTNLIGNIAKSNYSHGIWVQDTNNINISLQTAVGLLTGSDGIALKNSSNDIIQDCINVSGIAADIHLYNDSSSASVNDIFLNCSYNQTHSTIDAGNSLLRKWYYMTYVNDSHGNIMNGVYVGAFNNTNNLEFNASTNSSGYIPMQNITEYYNLGGSRTYYSNYTINATNGTYSGTKSYNVSGANKLNDVLTLSLNADTIYPTFTSNLTSPANNSQYYPNQAYQFNITITNTNGTTGIEFNGVNYTLSNISSSFYKTLNDLSAGSYNYYFWALGNGASNLFNKSQTYSYTIAKNSSLTLGISGTTPITYPTTTNVAGSNCPGQLSCSLNVSNAVYGVGTTNFNYSTSGNTNYSASSITKAIVINQNTTYSLGLTATTPITYPTATNFVGSNCPSELSCTLNISNGVFGVGVVNANYSTAGDTNYSARSSVFAVTINQNTSAVVYTYLNNSRSNISIYNGTAIYLNTSLLNVPGTLNLYNNGVLINSGSSPLSNSTTFNTVGVYNITGLYLGNVNYSGSYETWWVNVSAHTAYPIFHYNNPIPVDGWMYPNNWQVTFYGTVDNTNGTVGIEFAGVNQSLPFSSGFYQRDLNSIAAGNNSYYYWAYGNGSSNLFNRTATAYYNVLQNNSYLGLTFNPQSPIYVGNNVTITGSCGLNYVYLPEVTCNLYKDGIQVSNPYTANLPVGTYNFTENSTGDQNYTAQSISSIFTVLQNNQSIVYTYLNNSRSNLSIINNTGIWLNSTLFNNTGTVYLYNNGTLINQGVNISNFTSFNSTGLYNITGIYLGDSNHSSAYETWWLNVTPFIDTVYPIFTNLIDNSGTLTGSGIANFNATILNTNGTVLFQINGANYTATNLTANMYNFSINLTTGSYPYNWISWGNGSSHNFNITANTYSFYTAPSGGGGGSGYLLPNNLKICNEVYYFLVAKLDNNGNLNYTISDLNNLVATVSQENNLYIDQSAVVNYIQNFSKLCNQSVPKPLSIIPVINFSSNLQNTNCSTSTGYILFDFPLPPWEWNGFMAGDISCDSLQITSWFLKYEKVDGQGQYVLVGIRAWWLIVLIILAFLIIRAVRKRKY